MQDVILDDDLRETIIHERPLRYAGLGIRLGAALIDLLVMLPLIGLSIYNVLQIKSLGLGILILLLTAAYKPVMEYCYGATLGKMAVKIVVINQQRGSLTFGQALIRYLPWLVGTIVAAIALVEIFSMPRFDTTTNYLAYSMMVQESRWTVFNQFVSWLPLLSALAILFDKQRQAAHDMLAETYCVYKE